MPIINRFFLVLLVLFYPLAAYAEGNFYAIHFKNASNLIQTYHVEIALSHEEQVKGLMFRTHMPADGGMLFYYPQNQHITMWMRNTYIPLDMVFIDKAMRVSHIHHNALPEDETLIRSPSPVSYVVELNAGEAKRIGLKRGDKLIFSQEARHALSR